jgi:chromosome segregation ATPase
MAALANTDKQVIEKLQNRAEQSRSDLERRSSLLSQVQAQFMSLTATHAADRKRLTELESNYASLEKEAVELRSKQKNFSQTALVEQQEKFIRKSDEVVHLKREIDDLMVKLKTISKENESMASQFQTLTQSALDSESAKNTMSIKILAMTQEIESLRGEKQAATELALNAKSEANNYQQNVSVLEKSADMYRTQYEALFATYQTDNSANEAKFEELMREKDRDRQQIRRLEVMLQEAGDATGKNIQFVTNKLQECEEALKRSTEKESLLERGRVIMLEENEGLKKELSASFDVIERTKKQGEQTINALSQTIKSLEIQLSIYKTENISLMEKCAEMESHAKSLNDTIAKNRQQMDEMQTDIELSKITIKSLTNSMNNADTDLKVLEKRTLELAEKDRRIVELESELRSLSSVSSAGGEQLRKYKDMCETSQEREKDNLATIQQLNSAIRANDVEMKRLEDALDTRQVTIELLNKQMIEERSSTAKRVEILTRKEAAHEKRERELKIGVAKLLQIEGAMESELTCLHCMNIFDKPITLIDCGHNYCKRCEGGYLPQCVECHDKGGKRDRVSDVYQPDDRLSTLSGKFTYISQALAQIKQELDVKIE